MPWLGNPLNLPHQVQPKTLRWGIAAMQPSRMETLRYTCARSMQATRHQSPGKIDLRQAYVRIRTEYAKLKP